MRAVLVAIAMAAMALVPAVRAEAAGKVPEEFFGIVLGGPTDAQDVQEMHAIKVKTMRIGFNWKAIEPRPGVYRWPDDLVAMLAKNGIRPVFTVQNAPQWATGVAYQGSPPMTPKALRAFQVFLEQAVRRYGPEGSFWRDHPNVPKKAVKAWQIWNEPNLPKSFAQPGTDPLKLVKHAPKVYAKLVKAGDRAINRAASHVKVLLAGLLGNPNRTRQSKMSPEAFLKKFLKVPKITRHFDALGLHPYAPTIKKYKSVLKKIRGVLRNGGAGKKPLWLDEVGWGSAKNGFSLNQGKRGQAKMLRKSFALTLKNRRKWKVDHLYWFTWRDPNPRGTGGCSFCKTAGLLKFDRSHKPSYGQFKHFTEMQGKPAHHHHGGGGG